MQPMTQLRAVPANDERAAPTVEPSTHPSDESHNALEIAFHMTGVQAYLDYYQL